HWRDEPITTPRDRFHVARRSGAITQRDSDLPHAVVQALLEVDGGVFAPELANRLGARHEFPCPRYQQRQQSGRLRLEPIDGPVAVDLASRRVEFERGSAEAHRFLATETPQAYDAFLAGLAP